MGSGQEGGSLPAGICRPTRHAPQEGLELLPGLQQTPNCREIGPSITLGAGPLAARPGSSQLLALKGGWTGPAQVTHAKGNLTVMVWPALSRLAARDVGTEGSETTQPQTPVHQAGRPSAQWSHLPGQDPGAGVGGPHRKSFQWVPGFPSASRPPALPGAH